MAGRTWLEGYPGVPRVGSTPPAPLGDRTALGTPRLTPVGRCHGGTTVPLTLVGTVSPAERERVPATSVTCEHPSVRTMNDVEQQRTTDNNGVVRRRTAFPTGLTLTYTRTTSIRVHPSSTHASVHRDSVPDCTAPLGLWGSLYGSVPHGNNQ